MLLKFILVMLGCWICKLETFYRKENNHNYVITFVWDSIGVGVCLLAAYI